MLTQLFISNIVLIEKLDIQFQEGLSVFTGETGAGKSILLDSLSLALGARGNGSLVRHGCEQGEVIALFDVPFHHITRQILRENGFDDEGDIFLKRIQFKDGRSRAFVNDKPVAVSFLRDLGKYLIEIHGQHEDRVFVDPFYHKILLDSYAETFPEQESLKNSHKNWSELKKELIEQEEKIKDLQKEEDFLRAAIEELSLLDPKENEEVELSEKRTKLNNLEKIASQIYEAEEALNGPQSPVPSLTSLWRRLERKAEKFPQFLEPIIQSMAQAIDSLNYAQDHISNALRDVGFDPKELEKIEERLFALRAASRKYQYSANALHLLKEKYEMDLNTLDARENEIFKLQEAVKKAQENYDEKAQILSQKRKDKALILRKELLAELPDLKLEKADFYVHIVTNKEDRKKDGIDAVEFWVQTNPGTKAGPITKIASGGELSRFLLALKVALTDKISALSLIFDEVDTGVGGAVADSIGKRLKQLSKNIQVLSITHAPQIAARASTHFLISKEQSQETEKTVTHIQKLSQKDQIEEIARMLSGSEITDEARAAALTLLTRN